MIRARKRFGQHFLEPAWRVKVIDACAPSPTDDTLEIGPGQGALTADLAARVARVLAVEIDRDLAARLAAAGPANLQVVTADFLDCVWDALMAGWNGHAAGAPVRVVGNLPYNVSSPILFRLLEIARTHPTLRDATLMLQAEVAERLAAPAGTKAYGVLTVLTALAADVTPLLALPPGAFRPVPAVRSALVRLAFRPPAVPVARPRLVEQLVRGVFTQRRKTMANALKPLASAQGLDAAALLRAAGIDPARRPETLQLVEFVVLADAWPAGDRASPVL